MLKQIKQWLAAPVFPGDEEKTNQARIMNTIGLYAVLAMGVVGVFLIPLFAKRQLESWAGLLTLLILHSISRDLLGRGQLELAGRFMVTTVWMLCVGLVILGGGIGSPLVIALLAITIVIGFLFPTGFGDAFLGISLLGTLGLALFQQSGGTLPQVFSYSPLLTWFYVALGLLVMNRSATYVMGRLAHALALARQQNEARRQAEVTLRESEARLIQIASTLQEVVWLRDTQTLAILYVNPAYETVWGRTCASLYENPTSFLDAVHPDDKERVRQAIAAQQERDASFNEEYRIFQPNGSLRWVWGRTVPIKNEAGQVYRMTALVVDITARKRAEEALPRERDLIARIAETSPAGITFLNREGQIVFCNARAEQVLGVTKAEITQRAYNSPAWQITDYDGQPFPEEALPFRRVMTTRRPVYDVRHAMAGPDGRHVLLSINAAPLLDPSGQVDGMVTTVEDITARKATEQSLRALSARQEAILAAVPDILMEVDNHKVYTWANQAGYEFFGDEVIGQGADFYFEGAQDTYDLVQPLFGGTEEVIYVESWQRRRDGQKRLLAWWCRTLKDAQGQVIGALSSARDVTARTRAEDALRESEARFHETFEQAPIGVAHVSPSGQWIRVNRRLCEIVQYRSEELLQMKFQELTYPEDRAADVLAMQELLEGQRSEYSREKRYLRKDGSLVWVHLSAKLVRDRAGHPDYFVATTEDISPRKQAEAAWREHQANLTALIENTDGSIWSVDRAYALIAGNSVFHHDLQTAFGREFQVGECVLPTDLAPAVRQAWRDDYERALEGERFTVEAPRRFVDQTRMMEYHFSPIRGEADRVVGVTIFGRDSTERKRAEDEIRQRNAELTVLNQIGQSLNTLATPSEICETIFASVGQVLDNRNLYIALCDPLHQRISFPVYTINGERLAREPRPFGNGLTEYVLRTQAPLSIPGHFETTLGELGVDSLGRPTRCFLAAPLRVGERVIGVIAIQDYERENAYDRHQLELLTTVAAQAASALDNARLFEELQTSLAVTTRLYALSTQVLAATTVEETARLITENVRAGFAADACTVELFGATGAAAFRLSTGFSPEFDRETQERPHGLTARARQSSAPFVATADELHPRVRAEGIQTNVVLPLPGELANLGVLFVGFRQARHFDSPTRDVMALFANHAALAFRRVRLYQQVQQRLTELEAVHQISTALRAATTLEEMLPRFLDETLQLFDTDTGFLSLYDPESQALHRAAVRGLCANLPPVPLRPGEGIVGHVFATGEPYSTREISSDPLTYNSTRSNFPSGVGGACVPIRAAGEVIGTLFVAVRLPRVMAPDETRLLTTLAEIAGTAIQRTRLHTQTELQLRRLGALQAIDLAITASFDLSFTLNVVLQQVTDQLHVDAAAVLLYNPRAQTLDCAHARGFRVSRAERIPLDLRNPVVEQVLFKRQMIVVPDLSTESPSWARQKLLTQERFVTYFGVPLIAKGKVKGILEVWHRTALSPKSEWLDFLERLAAEAAIAVDNAELFVTLQRANLDMLLAYDATLRGWTRTLDLRDHETEGHSERVAETTVRLAQGLGIPEEQLTDFRRGALLHDIGKMGVPDAILLKPGPLSDEEWLIMKRHPQLAHDLLWPIEHLRPVLDIPYCHHERWDGRGYPRGLQGEQIPLAARIFAVVDVWDALISDRPYRKAWTPPQALAYLREQGGKHFDPRIVEAFFDILQNRPSA